MKIYRRLLLVFLLGIGLTYAVVAYQVDAIMQPVQQPTPVLTLPTVTLQPVTITRADGLMLAGWLAPSANGKTFILQHGYAANSADLLPIAAMLTRQGYGVLLYDFHGHGNSAVAPVTLGLTEVQDTQAAVAFLRSTPQTATDQLGILGVSMGGATALLASVDLPALEVIITDSAFADVRNEVAVGIAVKTPLPGKPLDKVFIQLAEWQTGISLSAIRPVDVIADLSPRPVLIIQGAADARVYPYNGTDLYAAAKAPKSYWLAPTGDHAKLYEADPAAYEATVVNFLNENWP